MLYKKNLSFHFLFLVKFSFVYFKNKYISFLEQLLINLKNAKLEYLRAGDVASQIEDKRYFNQQALLRNRFFHEVLSQLQNENINLKDLVDSNFNFDQLLISSIKGLKNSAYEKCLETDTHLKGLYQKIMLLPLDSSLFEKQFKRIESAIAHHETLHTSFNFASDN